MKIRRAVLFVGFVLLNVYLCVESPCQPIPYREEVGEDGKIISYDKRIQKHIELLRKQSLEETFTYLLESQQYHFPGYHPPGMTVRDMQTLLSARSFLKVFQELDALPKEQAIQRLREFCQLAITRFEKLEGNVRYNAHVTDEERKERDELRKLAVASLSPGEFLYGPSEYMLSASLFLAARAGEHQLLVDQIDKMQSIIDKFTYRIKMDDTIPSAAKSLMINETPPDPDVVLTILLYALKRAGKDTSIPHGVPCKNKTVQLCRWDALLTQYDPVVLRGEKLDPNDVVEQFDVYEFPSELFWGDPEGERQRVIHTLKERLLK